MFCPMGKTGMPQRWVAAAGMVGSVGRACRAVRAPLVEVVLLRVLNGGASVQIPWQVHSME